LGAAVRVLRASLVSLSLRLVRPAPLLVVTLRPLDGV
jgi:hypothetical protein